jgi:hypothetical protein
MTTRVIGTCSVCSGAVTVPEAWLGTVPPTPECVSCGAVAKQHHGPVIEMRPRQWPATLPWLDLRYEPRPYYPWWGSFTAVPAGEATTAATITLDAFTRGAQ